MDDSTKCSAVTILGSLIATSDHYYDFTVPSLVENDKVISMKEVKDLVYNYIAEILDYPLEPSRTDKYCKVICKTLYCSALIIYQETLKQKPNIEIIKKFFDKILLKINDNSVSIVNSALITLCSLTYLFPILITCCRQSLVQMFIKLSFRITSLTHDEDIFNILKKYNLINCMNATLVYLICIIGIVYGRQLWITY